MAAPFVSPVASIILGTLAVNGFREQVAVVEA